MKTLTDERCDELLSETRTGRGNPTPLSDFAPMMPLYCVRLAMRAAYKAGRASIGKPGRPKKTETTNKETER